MGSNTSTENIDNKPKNTKVESIIIPSNIEPSDNIVKSKNATGNYTTENPTGHRIIKSKNETDYRIIEPKNATGYSIIEPKNATGYRIVKYEPKDKKTDGRRSKRRF